MVEGAQSLDGAPLFTAHRSFESGILIFFNEHLILTRYTRYINVFDFHFSFFFKKHFFHRDDGACKYYDIIVNAELVVIGCGGNFG